MSYNRNHASVSLGGDWTFAFSEVPLDGIRTVADLLAAGVASYPAAVPGNFELDLMRNGLIEEPFYGMNIAALTRYEHAQIWYWRTFTAEEREGAQSVLTFEGLDVGTRIFLNGEGVGESENMLVPTEIPLSKLFPENELLVAFRPTSQLSQGKPYPPSLFALGANYEALYVRKAPHMYGWDIMPRALTPSVWRPVSIVYKPEQRIDRIACDTLTLTADHTRANISFSYALALKPQAGDSYTLRIEGACGESRYSHEARAISGNGKIRIDVPNPKLWQPKGRGDANLYNATVTLLNNGEPIDQMTLRHGIRTVKLEKTSTTDAEGSGEFVFWINGEKVFILGTNWVPLDAYHSRDRERLPEALALLDDIGCNMVRCWGGNVYEDDRFYDRCDELGILVWQDFGMACGFYPQDEAFQSQLRDEATTVVRRLRNHPCLALWGGDNECDEAAIWAHMGTDPNDNVLTRKVLPEVVRAESHGVPFLPSSPYIDEAAYNNGDFLPTPERHLWGPRNYYKSEFYTKFEAHFASEMGYHGCPSVSSLKKFLSPGKLWPYQDNEEWLLHCTSPVPGVDLYDYRVELMATQIRCVFGSVPDNLEEYVFASQAVQLEAVKFFVESFRLWKWRRTGIIWWNLLDGWPELSDAVVDYYFDKKLAYHAIKRSQSPLLVGVREPQDGEQTAVAVNDTREAVTITYAVTDIDTGAAVLSGTAEVPGDSVVELGRIGYDGSAQRFYAITWSSELGEGASHYLAGAPNFDLARYRGWLAKAGYEVG